MGSSWRRVGLGDLYEFSSGLSKPRSAFGSGYPFLSFKDVFYNTVVPKELSELVNSSDKERERCSIVAGDVFLTRTSETQEELGMSSVALRSIPDATFNGFTKRLRPKACAPIDPRYAAYYFRSPSFRSAVGSMSSLSTRASLNNEMLARLVMVLPPMSEQRTIASILGALDDKIELNRRISETLDGMAEAYYQELVLSIQSPEKSLQFVPLGEVTTSIMSGGTPSTREPAFWGGEVPWLSSGETRNRYVVETERTITPAGVEHSSTRRTRAGSIVIASAGQGHTRGQTSYLALSSYLNQSVIAVVADNGLLSDEYLFFDLARRYEEFRQMSDSHSSRGSLTTKLLAGVMVPIPDSAIRANFDALAVPTVKRIVLAQQESRTLASIRDALLPRMMSGELRVADAESIVERVV